MDNRNNILQTLYRIMITIFLCILVLTTFLSNYNSASILVYAAFFVFFLIHISKKYDVNFDTASDLKNIIFLSVICFCVKFLWIYYIRIEPKVDYATFYYRAVDLSDNWFLKNRYLALFPHIMGYSTFLSIFFKIFGESVFLASFINVILSVFSGIFIYKIMKNLVSSKAAVTSYIFWIICPSQTIYNSLVLSDPLYTTFILGFVYLITVINKKEERLSWIQMLLFGILSAIILQSINFNRPIGMILIIAMLIWIFILRFKDLFNKKIVFKWISFFVSLLIIYFSLGALWNVYFISRIGEAPASVPGYNIHVGFNVASSGRWNKEDSQLLFHYSNQEDSTADWSQQQMLKEAKKRIFSGDIDFTSLFKNKLSVFLGKDSACVDYCNDAITDKEYISMICNVFYYSMIILSILGAYKMLKFSHRSVACMLPLFVIGITCAQMLVEVAPRYHYSVVPFLIMIPQFYLFKTSSIEE